MSDDVSYQLKKITDHLGFLEKKIDQLLAQSSGGNRPYRPSFGNNARPFRSPGGFRGGHTQQGYQQGHPQGPHGTRSFHRRPAPHQGSSKPAPHPASAR